MKILYIPVEFSTWHAARSWSYSVQLALEEGFSSCGAMVITLPAIRGLSAEMPTSWLRHAHRMLKDQSFDQVWIELVHNNPGEHFLEWLKDIAPIRVGLVGESLDYDEDAILLHPHLTHRRAVVESRLKYMTHALFADECDAELAEQNGIVKGLWWPQAVPERCITVPSEHPEKLCALFAGIAYGQREKWLSEPVLTDLIEKVRSSEHSTYLPGLFDTVQSAALKQLEEGFVPELEHLDLYVDMLRQIRRRCFEHWLQTLQQGCAVINLPSFVKAYAGRVVEGMAAGRPVISWRIPHRPKIDELFVSGTDILHYSASNPAELAAQIQYVIGNPDAGRQIAERARLKLSLHHTVEKRVRQIMGWLLDDIKPDYCGGFCQSDDIRAAEFGQKFVIDISLDKLTAKAMNDNRESEVIDDVQISTYIASKELDKAIACLEPSSYYPEVKGMLARLHLAAGNTNAAAHLIYQALSDEPSNADNLIVAAELALKRDDQINTQFYLNEAGKWILNEQQRVRMAQMANPLDSAHGRKGDDQSFLVTSFIADTIHAAKKLALQGRIEEAVDKLLNQGIKADPSSPAPYIELVEILISAGRHDDALQVLPEMPPTTDRAVICEIEAICYAALGQDEAALQAATQVQDSPRALVVLGTLAARRGDLAGAEAHFRRAIEADPSCGGGWLSLGMLLWGQGRQEDAWHAVKRSVAVYPLNDEAIKILRDMAERIERISEVEKLIREAAQLYPYSRSIARHQAALQAQCGQAAEALEACETFIVSFGMDEELLSLALKIRQHIGIYDHLAEVCQHSISLCMIVKNEEQHLARCLASARPVVHEMIVIDTGSSDRTVDIATAFGARLSCFSWNGNFSDARNFAIEQAKGNWILVLDADEVLSARDYPGIVETVHSSADTADAWSVLTRNYTARVHSQGWTANDGVYPAEEQADGWYPSWKVRLFPKLPAIRFSGEVHEMVESSLRQSGLAIRKASFVIHHYGELAPNGKDPEKQLRYFESGMKKLVQNPDDLAAIAELAVQAGELGRFEVAVQLWDRLLERMPNAVEALFNKGYCLIGLKRYYQALNVSRRALELDPAHKEAAFNYGTCELYTGEPKRALTLIRPVADRNPDYPLLQALLAVLYFSCGMPVEGQEHVTMLRVRGFGIDTYIEERLSVLDGLGRGALADTIRSGNVVVTNP